VSASSSICTTKTRTPGCARAAWTIWRAHLVPMARTVPQSTTGEPSASSRLASATSESPTNKVPSWATS
jgi:hypothetical protein